MVIKFLVVFFPGNSTALPEVRKRLNSHSVTKEDIDSRDCQGVSPKAD